MWADRIRPGELHSEAELPRIAPSRGTHVTLRHEDLPLHAGAIVPAGEGGRSSRCRGWGARSSGPPTTTTTATSITCARPRADIDYLLGAVNDFFGTALGPGDATGAYAGVRPLVSSGDSRKSVDISRKAELYETSSGLITITGGKLTTWRRMARLVVDRIVERDGREAPCRTHEIPLGAPVDAAGLPRVDGVPEDAYPMLAGRYGHAAEGVLRIAAATPGLAAPIVDGRPDLVAEAAFAARHEQARTVGDVLLRRTRLGPAGGARADRPRRRRSPPGGGGDGAGARLGRGAGRRRGRAVRRRGGRRGAGGLARPRWTARAGTDRVSSAVSDG